MTNLGLSKDFSGLSTLLLGQAQPNQFQSSTDEQPTGWIWGSKVSDDGNFTALSSVANNANAEIPRSYDSGGANAYGGYYNWYAATAESGTYAMTSRNAEDSLCPAGWQLPSKNGDKSWDHLVFDAYIPTASYGPQSDTVASNTLRKSPLLFAFPGSINWRDGIRERVNGYVNYWTSGNYNNTNAYYFYLAPTSIYTMNNANENKTYGSSVRCVQRDEE